MCNSFLRYTYLRKQVVHLNYTENLSIHKYIYIYIYIYIYDFIKTNKNTFPELIIQSCIT